MRHTTEKAAQTSREVLTESVKIGDSHRNIRLKDQTRVSVLFSKRLPVIYITNFMIRCGKVRAALSPVFPKLAHSSVRIRVWLSVSISVSS